MSGERAQILHLRPGVDADELGAATIDSLVLLDRARWAPHLIVTEPSPNRRLHQLESLAEEVWDLPDQMSGGAFPEFILGFIESRGVRLLNVAGSPLAFDLLPDVASLPDPPAVVVQFVEGEAGPGGCVRYATRLYGDLVDAFLVADEQLQAAVAGHEIPPSRIELVPGDGEDAGRRQGELYERLRAGGPAGGRGRAEEPEEKAAAALAGAPAARLRREPPPERTVGVGVLCSGSGIHLDECIHSIKLQFLRPQRLVVVDDASEDPETLEALERLGGDPSVTVLRQPERRGSGAAGNRALEAFDTRYALWIDAHDRLLPGALDSMIAKLELAPEDVGFVYPHVKHAGNRSDLAEAPVYNLWLLMQRGICPSPSMFDMRVFDGTGVSFGEDVAAGGEDWDLALQLAERGIRGQHADGPTFLRRARGFDRPRASNRGPLDLRRDVEARHPGLYLDEDEVKARWAPALSIVAWNEGGHAWGEREVAALERQSCRDFELLAADRLGHRTRVVEGGADGEWLQAALREARGRWVCILTAASAPILENPAFVEQLLRSFGAGEQVAAVALLHAPELALHSFARLDDAERRSASLSGVAFEREPGAGMPVVDLAVAASTLESVVAALRDRGIVQWRLAASAGDPAAAAREGAAQGGPLRLDLGYGHAADRSEAVARRSISARGPRLPTLTPGAVPRWDGMESWMAPGTQPLCRHRHLRASTRIVTNDRNPPPGFELELDLGVTHAFAQPGTRRLLERAGTFELSDEQDEPTEGRGLGYVDERQLPLCERLELCEMPESGERVLVAGPDDPLHGVARPIAFLGCVRTLPIQPRRNLHAEPLRALTLYRRLDAGAGRHRYAVGPADDGSPAVAVGSLLSSPGVDLVALRLRGDGRLATELTRPGRATRHPRKLARWVARPPAPGDYWTPATRARNLVRHWPGRRLSDDRGVTLGWLRREGSPAARPLFSATHPPTGDQLVTRDLERATALGYVPDGVLGFVLAAVGNDEPEAGSPTVPWA